MTNLKQLLLELGNRLVTERRFAPPVSVLERRGKSTWPVLDFTDWLNRTPEAQEILAEMGVEWPMPAKKQA